MITWRADVANAPQYWEEFLAKDSHGLIRVVCWLDYNVKPNWYIVDTEDDPDGPFPFHDLKWWCELS